MTPPPHRCPQCRTPLEPARIDRHALELCRQCGGIWSTPAQWDIGALGPYPAKGNPEEIPGVVAEGASSLDCPACGTTMSVLGISEVDRLHLHRCDRCGGVWLAHEEWDSLQALREWERLDAMASHPASRGQWWFQFLSGLPTELNLRPKRRPWVTWSFMGLCVAVYVGGLFTKVTSLAFVPARAFHLDALPTFYTYAFVHANVVHLLGNLYFLAIIGDNVEDVLGHFGFGVFYTAAAIASALGFALVYPGSTTMVVGASGAISALFAAYVILFRKARLGMMFFWKLVRLPARGWVAIWLGLNVIGVAAGLLGVQMHTAFAGHLAGFLFGLVVIWPLRHRLIAGHPFLRLLASGRLKLNGHAAGAGPEPLGGLAAHGEQAVAGFFAAGKPDPAKESDEVPSNL